MPAAAEGPRHSFNVHVILRTQTDLKSLLGKFRIEDRYLRSFNCPGQIDESIRILRKGPGFLQIALINHQGTYEALQIERQGLQYPGQQLDFGRRIVLVDVLGNPLGIGAGRHQMPGRNESVLRRVSITESACIGEDGRVKIRCRLFCQLLAKRLGQPENEFACGAGMGIDQTNIAKTVIGDMVINIDDPLHRPDTLRFVSHSFQFAAIQDKNNIIGIDIRQVMKNISRPRQEKIIARRPESWL